MNKIAAVKLVTGLIVGSGTSKIVKTIIENNVDIRIAINNTPLKVLEKVSVAAGTLVIGAMAADVSRRYTDNKIDEAVAWYDENIKKPIV
jgi:hypothetical protein